MPARPDVWTPAVSPHPAPPRCDLAVVDDAVLTPFERSRLLADRGPSTVMRGAVHDADGRLVGSSQRRWAGSTVAPAAGDPDVVALPGPGTARLEGTWLYVGHWLHHFGHFVLEVLTNAWPAAHAIAPDGVAGIVAHRAFSGPLTLPAAGRRLNQRVLKPWESDLLALAGYRDVEVRIVRDRAARVERLVVPQRPVALPAWAAPEAVSLWRRVSDAVGDVAPHRRVFVSRSAFHRAGDGRRPARSDAAWDAELDATFAASGFHVLHPERHPVAEQVAVVRGAEVLAGPAGSGLHLSAFAPAGTRVLEVGDRRSPDFAMPSQRVVDAACGHLTAHVAHEDRAGLRAVLAELA